MAKRLPVVRGLRKRWLLNSVGPVIIIMVLIAFLAAGVIDSTYYGSARSSLEAKAKAGADYFNTYTMNSYSEYYRAASLYVASFDESDVIELQFLNVSGRIETSTRGLTAGTSPDTMDISRALETGKVASFNGPDPATGERIMAVSSPLVFNGTVVGVMRYVSSLKNVDRQVLLNVLAAAGIGVAIMAVVFVINMVFIRSIIIPIQEIMAVTHRIAAVNGDGTFVTRGDANPVDDSLTVRPEQVIGKYTGKTRFFIWLGSFGSNMTFKKALLIIVMIIVAFMSVFEIRSIARVGKDLSDAKKAETEKARKQLIREEIEKEKLRLAEQGGVPEEVKKNEPR